MELRNVPHPALDTPHEQPSDSAVPALTGLSSTSSSPFFPGRPLESSASSDNAVSADPGATTAPAAVVVSETLSAPSLQDAVPAPQASSPPSATSSIVLAEATHPVIPTLASSSDASPSFGGDSHDETEPFPLSHLSPFHVLAVVGSSFAISNYTNFLVSITTPIVGSLYPITSLQSALLSSMSLAGAAAGQALCGLLIRLFGKGVVFLLSLAVLAVSLLGSALSFDSRSTSIYSLLILWRFVGGFALGLDYPLSASITTEYAKCCPQKTSEANLVAANFSLQGIGNVMSNVVALIFLAALDIPLDVVWRLPFLVALLACLILLPFRIKLHRLVERNEAALLRREAVEARQAHDQLRQQQQQQQQQHVQESPHPSSIRLGFANVPRRELSKLAGCAVAWLLFDFAFYGTSLFSSTVVEVVTGVSGSVLNRSQLIQVAEGTLLVSVIGLPGYFVAIWLLGRVSVWHDQVAGFIGLTFIYYALGVWFAEISSVPALFIVVFGLSFFVSNMGPNTTTFIMPARVFETAYRTRFHGVAASVGKTGAIAGAFSFPYLVIALGVSRVLFVCGSTSFVGLLVTLVMLRPSLTSALPASTAHAGGGPGPRKHWPVCRTADRATQAPQVASEVEMGEIPAHLQPSSSMTSSSGASTSSF